MHTALKLNHHLLFNRISYFLKPIDMSNIEMLSRSKINSEGWGIYSTFLHLIILIENTLETTTSVAGEECVPPIELLSQLKIPTKS